MLEFNYLHLLCNFDLIYHFYSENTAIVFLYWTLIENYCKLITIRSKSC